MGLWLAETLLVIWLHSNILSHCFNTHLLNKIYQLPNSAIPESNLHLNLLSCLYLKSLYFPSLSVNTVFHSLLNPVTEHVQSPHQHLMSRTACVNLLRNGFAQLGFWVVLSYFCCLSNCRHTVLKNICPLPGILASPFFNQCTFQGCKVNVSVIPNKMCPVIPDNIQLWYCRVSPDVLWNSGGSLQHWWAVFTNSEFWVWIATDVHSLKKGRVPVQSLPA